MDNTKQLPTDPLDIVIEFLKQRDELDLASTLLSTFEKYSDRLEQFDHLGRLFSEVKDFKKAIDCANKTLALSANPQHMYAARANLAKMYNHLNQPQKALQYIDVNLSINPNDHEGKIERVFSLYLMGKPAESYELTKELIADPACPKHIRDRCLFNSGSYQLDEGNFKEGIRNFIDVGHQIGIWQNRPLPNPWDGKVVEGAKVVVIAEGGIGDEIINIRFFEDIEAMGMTPILVSNHKLASLFVRNGFDCVDSLNDIPRDDVENTFFCYSFYLPILLDLDKDNLDRGVYLRPDPKFVEKWKGILPGGKKVALRWSGNPYYEHSLHRNLSLTAYMDAFGDTKNVTFISVQRDTAMDELNTFPQVFNAAPFLESLDDLLACLFLCDQTITSCTSVAHVAAASGCTVTVLPPISCYYVWLGSGNDWYSKDRVTVIRQTEHKNWSNVLEKVKIL